ncbi:hypothetical protein KIW74_gp33 [Mycobacterium phage Kimona]|uniref:Uncharacterized protein n=1 Tax=Mycobacterium phage Kimona TaxID=2024295 RepID=A0A249XU25_9CAUD|nr:hypothetical protein KIW74_gp33 [Mycobacterium phage Kimona]ASZ75495.1 hypothetical protein PBI_KIMONA_59 [Mycobacterium phage Kimona]
MSEDLEVEILAIHLWWLPDYARGKTARSFYSMDESVREEYRKRARKLLDRYDMKEKPYR